MAEKRKLAFYIRLSDADVVSHYMLKEMLLFQKY